jgi:hypothetical protein
VRDIEARLHRGEDITAAVAPVTVLRELGLLRCVMVTANHEWGVSVPITVFEFVKSPSSRAAACGGCRPHCRLPRIRTDCFCSLA